MAYKRTDAIKLKQSLKMKQVVKTYDWDSIKEKRSKTIKENNSTIGRPKGITSKKTGWFKKCKMCDSTFWVVPSSDERRIYCSKACMSSDEVYIKKLRDVAKTYMQTEEYKSKKRDPNLPAYKRYAREVRMLTEKTYVQCVDIINPNRYTRTLCGVKGGWQLDHVKSIKKCYNEGVSVEQAADVSNLQMILWENNLAKRTYEKVKN